MPRKNPFFVPVSIVRFSKTLTCRVSFDSAEVARALKGSNTDQTALCIQTRKALYRAYRPTFVGTVAADWPGYIQWHEIEPHICRAREAADIQAREQFLEEEYWLQSPIVTETFGERS